MNSATREIPRYIRDEAATGRGYNSRRLNSSGRLEFFDDGTVGPSYAYKVRGKWTIYYYRSGLVTVKHEDDLGNEIVLNEPLFY